MTTFRGRTATTLVAVMVALLVANGPAAAQEGSLLTAEQEAWLDERDRIVVLGTDDTYRPYVYFDDDGELTGITGDYVALLEARLDITIAARRLPSFSATLDAAAMREIDIVPNVVASGDRPFLVFTDSYISVIDRILVRADDETDYTLADLGDRPVASVTGYQVTEFIDSDFPQIDLVRVATEVEGLRLLSTGAVDAMVADLGVVSYAVREEGISNLRVAGTVDSLSEQRFGVRSDQPILGDILDAGLASITERERDEITARWIQLGPNGASASTVVLWVVGIAAFASVLVAAGALVWNRTLRRRVDRSTGELHHELEEHERTEVQRSRLELAIAHAAELVVVVDANRSVRYLNPTYERVTGRSPDDQLGRPIDALFTEAADRATIDVAEQALADEGVWRGRLALLAADDTAIPVEGAIASVTLPSGEPGGFVGTLRDATQEERLQAQLQESARLKAVGTLAAGIAHDFNNLLTPILGGVELAGRTDDDTERAQHLMTVEAAARRATELVLQVRSFSLDESVEPEDLDLGGFVCEAIELIRHSCPDDVEILTRLTHVPLTVTASPTQVHQLVMNLLTNAVQSMEDSGGRLLIELDRAGPAPGEGGAASAQLVVTDTGPGIEPEIRHRLFEPYFSTRTETGGTGLGLFTVAGIVRWMGGTIEVDDHGGGTAMRVRLPLADRPAPRRHSAAEAPVAEPAAGGRILVVDDDAAVLEVLESLLGRLGHEVTPCPSGDAALARIDEGIEFDLLVTDLGMPEMRGDELARRVRERHPDVPIVMLTGHHDADDQGEDWSVLAKPVRLATLDATVREAMAPTG